MSLLPSELLTPPLILVAFQVQPIFSFVAKSFHGRFSINANDGERCVAIGPALLRRSRINHHVDRHEAVLIVQYETG